MWLQSSTREPWWIQYLNLKIPIVTIYGWFSKIRSDIVYHNCTIIAHQINHNMIIITIMYYDNYHNK